MIYGGNGVDLLHQGTGDATITLGTGGAIKGNELGLPGEALELTTTNAESDLIVQGTRDAAGALTGEVSAEQFAIDLHTSGADILVQDLLTISAVYQNAIEVGTDGGDVTILNLGSVGSQYGKAINVDSTVKTDTRSDPGRGEPEPASAASGNVSIQNVSISEFELGGHPAHRGIL